MVKYLLALSVAVILILIDGVGIFAYAQPAMPASVGISSIQVYPPHHSVRRDVAGGIFGLHVNVTNGAGHDITTLVSPRLPGYPLNVSFDNHAVVETYQNG